MTLAVDRKTELLLSFHTVVRQRGWTFTESGPREKDRQLLVEFDSAVNLPEKGGWYTPFHWSGTGGLNMRPIA